MEISKKEILVVTSKRTHIPLNFLQTDSNRFKMLGKIFFLNVTKVNWNKILRKKNDENDKSSSSSCCVLCTDLPDLLTFRLYHPSLEGGLPGYIPDRHRTAVEKF